MAPEEHLEEVKQAIEGYFYGLENYPLAFGSLETIEQMYITIINFWHAANVNTDSEELILHSYQAYTQSKFPIKVCYAATQVKSVDELIEHLKGFRAQVQGQKNE